MHFLGPVLPYLLSVALGVLGHSRQTFWRETMLGLDIVGRYLLTLKISVTQIFQLALTIYLNSLTIPFAPLSVEERKRIYSISYNTN